MFPKDLQGNNIHPIHKSGDAQNVTNYRPIAILNGFAKIFERLIHTKLQNHVRLYLSETQHGFLSKHCSVIDLLEYVGFLMENLEMKQQIDVIYLDFSKAFDTNSHNILLSKLSSFGVNGALLQWFSS